MLAILTFYRKEHEVQVMLNRLAHLEQEHVRIQRRTDITHKKANDIIITKAHNEERLREHQRLSKDRIEEEERLRLQNMQMKILSRRESALKLQAL
jgi:hypothetical protein